MELIENPAKSIHDYHVYRTRDDLPEELRPFWSSGKVSGFFDWIHHPLYVTCLPTMSPMPLDQLIREKGKRVEKMLQDGDLSGYVFTHERGYRMGKLLELVHNRRLFTPDSSRRACQTFWELAANVWTDAEFSENDPVWSYLMNCGVPHQGFMTRMKDRKRLASMSQVIRVYRGVQAKTDIGAKRAASAGWQWTLSPKIAAFFARRFLQGGSKPYVLSGMVDRKHVKAFLTGRNEAEILIPPRQRLVKDVQVKVISRKASLDEKLPVFAIDEEDWID